MSDTDKLAKAALEQAVAKSLLSEPLSSDEAGLSVESMLHQEMLGSRHNLNDEDHMLKATIRPAGESADAIPENVVISADGRATIIAQNLVEPDPSSVGVSGLNPLDAGLSDTQEFENAFAWAAADLLALGQEAKRRAASLDETLAYVQDVGRKIAAE